MEKKHKYIFLLLIPVLFFFSGNLLKEGQGPYYLNFYDPSYVYLINSLNLAQLNGYGVGHFDHPGTTVQVLGAIIIYSYHLINNNSKDIPHDVLERPEDYLKVINKIFGMLNTLMLFLLGCFAFKITGNLLYSLLIQFTPFTSMEIFYGYIIVTPDNFLIVVALCLIAVLIYYIYSGDDLLATPYSLVFSFAFVTALGMATKLNFLPMAIIPLLIIKGVKRKFIFLGVSILLFHIFIFPALSNYTQFTEWITRLIIYSGHYGQGEATVVNSSEFFMNLGLIFTKDTFFTFTYFSIILTIVICLIRKQKIEKGTDVLLKKQLKLLFVIFIAVTFQIVIVAKQYRQHYMIPSFLISIFSLSLCASVLAYHFKKLKVTYSYIVIIILISIWSLNQIILNYNLAVYQRTEAFKIDNFIKDNYSDNFIISTFFSSASKQCALAFGVYYAGSQTERYESVLRSIQKNQLFYNPWINRFESISGNVDIKNLLVSNPKVIVQISEYGIHAFIKTLNEVCGVSNSSFTRIFVNGNGECVYEVKVGDR
ncbi:MAG: hypothetical protein M3R36_04725 [Bacteroidota bacterium]|nr:hypothetical protein [Bacteroidota bacterium]